MNVSILFLICLIAHGTLYEERPPASGLTNFYLTAALGGWLGGAFSSLVAPQIFKGLYDYPLLLMLSAFAFWWCCDKSFLNFWTKAPFSDTAFRTSIIGVVLVLIVMLGWPSLKDNVIFRHRNFYGTYRIIDVIPFGGYRDGIRVLCHGAAVHGSQLLNPGLHKVPTSYYQAVESQMYLKLSLRHERSAS
jgi:hypothetical protein